jgi:hypothetical protein
MCTIWITFTDKLKHVFGPQFEELINWTGPFFTKIWSIHFAQNVDMIIWTTWCNMDRSMFQKIEVVHIPKVFHMTKI